MSTSLHPNLARIAAAYDEIFARYAEGRTDANRARAEIAALVARDDEGVQWSIDFKSGAWLRRTRTGELVADTPPSYGYATATAHDLTQNSQAFNPDSRITFHKVDDDLLTSPGQLSGSTRRSGAGAKGFAARASSPRVRIAAGAVALCAVALLAMQSCEGDDASTTQGTTLAP